MPARTVSRVLRPPRAAPAVRPGPDDRGGDPLVEGDRGPLRAVPARRAGAHGRQEARAHPRRRRVAGAGRAARETTKDRTHKLGYDYVHSLVDDHSRLAYSEILADEKGATCAAFLDPRRGLLRRPRHRPDRAGDDRQRLGLPVVAARGHHAPWAPARSSSSRTAPGRTARSNASTAPWPPNGPTGRSSPATPNAPPPLPPGSSTTTLDAATAHSAASPRSAACHQPDGRVHLGRRLRAGRPQVPLRSPGPTARARVRCVNGAQALIRTLVDAGVDVCFANPGTSEMHFVAALDDVPDMRAVLTLFEGVATGAADGYARMAGRPAATLLHLGPGHGQRPGQPAQRPPRRARRWSTSSATTRARTSGWTRRWSPTSTRVAGTVSGWVRRSLSPADVAGDAAEAVAAASSAPGSISTLILPGRRVVGGRRRGRPHPLPARPAPAGGAVRGRGRRGGARPRRADGAVPRRRRDGRRRPARRGAGGRRHRRAADVGDLPGADDARRRAARRRRGCRTRRRWRSPRSAGRSTWCSPGRRRRCTSSATPTCPATRCPRTAPCTCSARRGRTASPRCRRWREVAAPDADPGRAGGVAAGAADRAS